MQVKSLLARTTLGLATILLTASCADFFQDNKATSTKNTNSGNNLPAGQLPGEFQKPNEGPFSEQKMLINIGLNVISRSADDFAAQVPVLKQSVRQYCEALAAGSSAQRQENQVKMDWERTMMAFHSVRSIPLGPLMDDGRFLNDYIYSWPYLNTCNIDKNVFENVQAPTSSERLLFNVRGLGAIEYLLFENSYVSTCNMRANPTMADWNARTLAQKKLDRCVWAQELMNDIDSKAQGLKIKWAVEQGNFTHTLVNNTRYPNTKEAINALTDALADIEILKDAKLGKPTARHKDCYNDKCPSDVEHRYSGASLLSAEAQLKTFKAVFTGSYAQQEAYGLKDLLGKSGRADVAQKLIRAIDQALASVVAAQDRGTLEEQVLAMDPELCKQTTMTDRKVEICAVHADVREVAFLLKTEVLAALALRAPPTHQGDND